MTIAFNDDSDFSTFTFKGNIVTEQSAAKPRFKRILYTGIGIIVILALFIGFKVYNRTHAQSIIRPKVIAAVRADFPDFCTGSEIFAEPSPFPYNMNALFADHDSQWGIKCDAWIKSIVGYKGEVTIMDIDHCTTIRPIVGTLSEYYNEYEAINQTNGQKLVVCP